INMQYINLQSSDGMIYSVDLRIAKCFGIIKTMLQICKIPEDQNSVVPLARVDGNMLLKLLLWAEHHVNDPEPTDDDAVLVRDNDDISAWEASFLRVDQSTLLDLMLAANYMNIKRLQEAACKTVANMIQEKTVVEMRKTFNIESDFSPEEEEQVRQENEWMEE
ncbi:hypothetical protein KR018_002230, partial [Drosophila ironensis]